MGRQARGRHGEMGPAEHGHALSTRVFYNKFRDIASSSASPGGWPPKPPLVLDQLRDGELAPHAESVKQVLRAEGCLRHYLPLTTRVITQSQARIFQGETRHP